MAKTKVAITVDEQLLDRLDALVASRRFPNRSQAIEAAVEEKLSRLKRSRLAEECAKLDPEQEKSFAEEGFAVDMDQWPAY